MPPPPYTYNRTRTMIFESTANATPDQKQQIAEFRSVMLDLGVDTRLKSDDDILKGSALLSEGLSLWGTSLEEVVRGLTYWKQELDTVL